jgi:hypothetical protein
MELGTEIQRENCVSAAADLYEAARLQEEAESFNANCPDCDGEGVPECCETCFPLFDDARLKRRAVLEKAGYPVYQTERCTP